MQWEMGQHFWMFKRVYLVSYACNVLYVCMYVCIYVYIHIYIHTYIHLCRAYIIIIYVIVLLLCFTLLNFILLYKDHNNKRGNEWKVILQ